MSETIPIPGFADPVSSLTHLLGAAIFAVLSVPLLWRASHSKAALASEAIFCIGAVSLLAISGIYHSVNPDGAARQILRRLDHAAIFILIAASFTPAHIILFRGWKRWGILSLVWLFGLVAMTWKMIYFDEMSRAVGVSLYLIMGWIGTGTGILLWQSFGFRFMLPIFLGGVAYSIGAILQNLGWPTLVPGVFQAHELFHILVLIALGIHWAFNYSIADGMRTAPVKTLNAKKLAA